MENEEFDDICCVCGGPGNTCIECGEGWCDDCWYEEEHQHIASERGTPCDTVNP